MHFFFQTSRKSISFNILLRFFLLSIFLLSITYTSSQVSNELQDSIDKELISIDKKVELKQYDLALEKLSFIENYKNYISIPNNKYNVDLKKVDIYLKKKDNQKAIAILLDNFGRIDKAKNSQYYYEYSEYLGNIFQAAKKYNRARYYYRYALSNSEELRDSTNIIKFNFRVGGSFHSENKYDSAMYYYAKVKDFPVTKEREEYLADIYNNIGLLASRNKDYENAENYGLKFLNLKRKANDDLEEATALNNLGTIFHEKGDLLEAEKIYKEAYEILKGKEDLEAVKNYHRVLQNLAFVNEDLKNYKEAIKYLYKSIDVNDVLVQKTNFESEIALAAEAEAQKLANDAQKAEDDKSKQQILFYSAAFSLITLLVLGYIFYRNYRLKQENKLEHIENETQTKLINATIDAKEIERKAIAEILHDSVSALLSSANLHLQATKAQLKDAAPQEITKAQKIVNEASVKIRDLSHDLISSILLKFGLAFAVHDMCQKYSNSEITLHSDDNGIKRYNQDFEIKIHSIIEELINNILKHSKASNATVMLSHKENDMLSVRISDDGVGFDPKNVKGKDGLGLSHIEARIKVMKGVFNIVSSKDNGTNIFILVPIKLKENI